MTGRIFSGAEAFELASPPASTPTRAAARSTAKEIAAAARGRGAIKRLMNLSSDADTAAILLAEFEGADGADRLAKSDRGGTGGDGGEAGTLRQRGVNGRLGRPSPT